MLLKRILLSNVQNSFVVVDLFFLAKLFFLLWNQQTMWLDNETNNSSVQKGYFSIETFVSKRWPAKTVVGVKEIFIGANKKTIIFCVFGVCWSDEIFIAFQSLSHLKVYVNRDLSCVKRCDYLKVVDRLFGSFVTKWVFDGNSKRKPNFNS